MRLRSLFISTLLIVSAMPGQAADLLKPYKAVYKAQWDMGHIL